MQVKRQLFLTYESLDEVNDLLLAFLVISVPDEHFTADLVDCPLNRWLPKTARSLNICAMHLLL